MAHLPLGFRLFLLIGLSLALPFPEHEGDANDKPDSYNKEDEFQDYFQYVSELMAKAPSEPSEESGKILAMWTPESGVNPEEVGGYLEGDIVSPIRSASRTAVSSLKARWPFGVIPYEIADTISQQDKKKILEVFGLFQTNTCIKFVPRRKQADYIRVTNSFSGCWSSLGRIGGKQDVNLQPVGCFDPIGRIIHELMHAVGVIHEQSRWDRDDYVTINWENIPKSYISNFDKAEQNTTDNFGVDYDYGSVMHFSKSAFSSNGQPTIVPKGTNADIGQRFGFSKGDITKLKKMYGC